MAYSLSNFIKGIASIKVQVCCLSDTNTTLLMFLNEFFEVFVIVLYSLKKCPKSTLKNNALTEIYYCKNNL